MFPLAGYYRGSTLMLSVHGPTLTFSFGKVPLTGPSISASA